MDGIAAALNAVTVALLGSLVLAQLRLKRLTRARFGSLHEALRERMDALEATIELEMAALRGMIRANATRDDLAGVGGRSAHPAARRPRVSRRSPREGGGPGPARGRARPLPRAGCART